MKTDSKKKKHKKILLKIKILHQFRQYFTKAVTIFIVVCYSKHLLINQNIYLFYLSRVLLFAYSMKCLKRYALFI